MRAFILLTALATATAACAVSPDVSPYPPDAQTGMSDAMGPVGDAEGPPPDAQPMGQDAGGPGPGGTTVGWPEPFLGTNTLIQEQTLFAFRLPTIPVEGSLDAWGIIPVSGATLIAMAIYTDFNNEPAELIYSSEWWQSTEQEYPADGAPLPAGDYWLVVFTETAMEIGIDPGQEIISCQRAGNFGAPFDTSFGVPDACSFTPPPNVYIRLGAPPEPPPADLAGAPR